MPENASNLATFGRLGHRIDVGFNIPVGRARTSVVDLLEPADCFQHPRFEQLNRVKAGGCVETEGGKQT